MTTIPSYMGGPQSAAGAATGSQPTPQTHAMPTHMAPHHHATPPHSQTNHMSSQGGASGGHPNPSPVPQHGSANHLSQQGHHPSNSGTPQPQHVIYQHGTQAAPQQAGPGHPPLQPSPNTPTSPQTIYPPGAIPFSQNYAIQPHQFATSTPGGQQQILTLTHSHHHQHPQLAMMAAQHQPNPHQSNHQLQHGAMTAGGQPQQPGQFQLNHAAQLQQGHHVQGGYI